MKKNTHTKIICTIGPASWDRGTIARMAKAGMTIARINFSHGERVRHLRTIENIRYVNTHDGRRVLIMQDLEGYRIRIGHLKKAVRLKCGEHVWMNFGGRKRSGDIPLDLNVGIAGLKKGMSVFVSDGMIELKVLGSKDGRVRLEVVQGGKITSKKGVNIPGLKLRARDMTEKDKEDLEFGIRHRVDMVALSFVRNKQDVLRARRRIAKHLPHCQIIAKIESREGIRNLDGILTVSDGIIVARGDLGVSLPIYQLPIFQKRIIRQCNAQDKPVMTATQMLESMTEYNRPTRAEVTDVANAIFDGTDYVMLSGETAVGKYPVAAVRMMAQIILFTEQSRRGLS